VTALRPPDETASVQLQTADVVVLASGSAAEAWRQAEPGRVRPAIVAIGPKTAAAALQQGFAVAVTASSPADDDVANAVVAALS
jgi:uroporphyrinogen-III synthase